MRLLHVLLVLACSSPAAATETSSVGYHITPLEHEGERGFWFSRHDTLRLLDDVDRRLPLALDIIEIQSSVIELQRDQIRTATAALSLTSSIADVNLEYANTWKTVAEARVCRSLWCDPAFISIGSFLLGAAATTVVWSLTQ